MRQIFLTELETTFSEPLTPHQRDALRKAIPGLSVVATPGHSDIYDLRPERKVGLVRVGDLQVEIAPKLPIGRVMFLLSYALDPQAWDNRAVHSESTSSVVEAIVPVFARAVRHALRRGLLHGYRSVDESALTVRGRIRFADQIRSRPGQALPIELSYDELTTDIVENQLLATAIERLLRLRLRSIESRRMLFDLREQFRGVNTLRLQPGQALPQPVWTRLNDRYRPAVGLAALILANSSLEARSGRHGGDGVLIDLAVVFESFVIAALRDALGLGDRAFPRGAAGRSIPFDHEETIQLRPDLSWWDGDDCIFAGDCKYKWMSEDGPSNADLYQLLAYLTALDLDEGLLVYAAGKRVQQTWTIRHAGKRLTVVAIDLAGSPEQVLTEIRDLAGRVRAMADLARTRSRFAAV